MSRRSSDREEGKSSRRPTITSKRIPNSGRRTEGPRHLQPDVPGKFHHSLTRTGSTGRASFPACVLLRLAKYVARLAQPFLPSLERFPDVQLHPLCVRRFLMDLGKQVAVGGARPGEQPPPHPLQGFLPPRNVRRLISALRSSKFRPGGARSPRLLGAFHEIFTKTWSSTLAFSWTEGR